MRPAVCSIATLLLAAPALAQSPSAKPAETHRTVFAIQPIPDLGNDEDRRGPRLELERALSRRFSVVVGTQLTLRNDVYLDREPAFRRLDLGVRYYARRRALDGPFLGLYGGYDRVRRGNTIDTIRRVPAGIAGGTVGWVFRPWSRLTIAPAFGLEYGRPEAYSLDRGRYFTAAPRIGFGISF